MADERWKPLVEEQGVAYAKTVAEAMNLKIDADNPADRRGIAPSSSRSCRRQKMRKLNTLGENPLRVTVTFARRTCGKRNKNKEERTLMNQTITTLLLCAVALALPTHETLAQPPARKAHIKWVKSTTTSWSQNLPGNMRKRTMEPS